MLRLHIIHQHRTCTILPVWVALTSHMTCNTGGERESTVDYAAPHRTLHFQSSTVCSVCGCGLWCHLYGVYPRGGPSTGLLQGKVRMTFSPHLK